MVSCAWVLRASPDPHRMTASWVAIRAVDSEAAHRLNRWVSAGRDRALEGGGNSPLASTCRSRAGTVLRTPRGGDTVRLVHDDGTGSPRTLADRVEIADSFLAQARGLMFRRSLPAGAALVFRFPRTVSRTVHMVFVPFPIDVVWLEGATVTTRRRLRPWIGLGRGRGDAIVELPAGAAEAVEPGDEVRLEPPPADHRERPRTG